MRLDADAVRRRGVRFSLAILIGRVLHHVLFVPLSFVVAPLLVRARVRVWLLANPERIGHLAMEPDCYVKEQLLGLAPPARATFLLCRRDRVVNHELLRHWKRYFRVVSSAVAYDALRPLAFRRGVGVDAGRYVGTVEGTASFPRIQASYGDRPPLLELSSAELERGRAALERLGLPADAWYVCVHCREPGFYDDGIHDYRNADIANFAPAIAAITAAGGWCIRMGDPSMSVLPSSPRVIDYAHHPERSDQLDLFFVATCRFFLGTSSGLLGVAVALGAPAAITNQAPMGVVLPMGVNDVAIPKLTWSDRERRVMSFREVLGTPLGDYRFDRLYEEHGVRTVENDSTDIRALTLELLERTAGGSVYTSEDEELQLAFKALMCEGHHSFGAASRVGRAFLRRHRDLIGVPNHEPTSAESARGSAATGGDRRSRVD